MLRMPAEGGLLLKIFSLWDLIPISGAGPMLYLLHSKTSARYSTLFMSHFNFLAETGMVIQNAINQGGRGKCMRCVSRS